MIADSFDRAQGGLETAWGDQCFWFKETCVKGSLRGSAIRSHGVGTKQSVAATL